MQVGLGNICIVRELTDSENVVGERAASPEWNILTKIKGMDGFSEEQPCQSKEDTI